jgi:hypothetical protein
MESSSDVEALMIYVGTNYPIEVCTKKGLETNYNSATSIAKIDID